LSTILFIVTVTLTLNPIYVGVIRSKVKVTVTINIILTTGSFPHDDFSSVYWIFTKLDHMISLLKGKNPVYLQKVNVEKSASQRQDKKRLKNFS
jgi:hypothetical protein